MYLGTQDVPIANAHSNLPSISSNEYDPNFISTSYNQPPTMRITQLLPLPAMVSARAPNGNISDCYAVRPISQEAPAWPHCDQTRRRITADLSNRPNWWPAPPSSSPPAQSRSRACATTSPPSSTSTIASRTPMESCVHKLSEPPRTDLTRFRDGG